MPAILVECHEPPVAPRKRSIAIVAAIATILLASSAPPGSLVRADTTGTRPNVLLVILDDFGIDSSPCYDTGTEKPSMPTLSRLCQDGLVFDRFWAAPECSPTRAMMLTGKYGFRTGVGAGVGRADAGLSPDELSLHTFLTQEGVRSSAVIGKWHLATDANGWTEHPSLMGVPHYAGLLTGAPQSYSRWLRTENGRSAMETRYITSQLTDEASTWIAKQDAPWFLWLAYTAPHAPLHVPPASLHDRADLTGAAADIARRPLQYHFAMAEALDRELGRLLDTMDPAVRARTVVVVLGDNGTAANVIQPASLRGRAKSTLYEGGIHTPLIVSGAGVARAGQREAALVSAVDLFSTIAELAGSSVTAWRDSWSFAPLLATAQAPTRPDVYAEYFGSDRPESHGWTIRDDRYKLIALDSGRQELYDLAADPSESTNLIGSGDPGAVDAHARLVRRGTELRASRQETARLPVAARSLAITERRQLRLSRSMPMPERACLLWRAPPLAELCDRLRGRARRVERARATGSDDSPARASASGHPVAPAG